ncbi:NUDIX hydrolase [Modicisalibacter coralii]|uniref:NUDIX hydrolase n=1 Tax=Modicisalibacter coralii TaxID=2304602 RepID=UPI00100B935C|nr:NUDIX domain-containing protein [Halomonas coralii]
MPAPTVLSIAAAVIVDDRQRLLLVRKRGSPWFMQPGGKIDEGETPEQALHRELREELGSAVTACRYLGAYRAPAANEPGVTVHAELFRVTIDTPPVAAAEIEELRWVARHQAGTLALAALTREHVLPLAYPEWTA